MHLIDCGVVKQHVQLNCLFDRIYIYIYTVCGIVTTVYQTLSLVFSSVKYSTLNWSHLNNDTSLEADILEVVNASLVKPFCSVVKPQFCCTSIHYR